jgi:hypothetical protein
MPMRRLALALALVFAATACGSDKSGGTGPNTTRNGSMSARIDGANWSASGAVAAIYQNNIFSVAGTSSNGAATFGFAVGPATGPGTFTTGQLSAVNAHLTQGSQGWQAALTNGTGTVTLTTLTAGHAVGTFSFTLVPVAGSGAAGNKSVTSGTFDVTW